MKPAEKIPVPKTDMSVRDLKLNREEKSIPLRLNKPNERSSSPTPSGSYKKSA
jgi:hypothetical protein